VKNKRIRVELRRVGRLDTILFVEFERHIFQGSILDRWTNASFGSWRSLETSIDRWGVDLMRGEMAVTKLGAKQ
jgi:hypothetical protein